MVYQPPDGTAWQSHVRFEADELADLWRRYGETREDSLRNLLVEHYLPLATGLGTRFHGRLPKQVDVDEAISAAVAGLTAAVEAFDLSRGVKFETYCRPRIAGAIRDALRDADWLPRVLRTRLRHWETACGRFQTACGRRPEAAEVAGALGVSPASCEMLTHHAAASRVASLDDQSPGYNAALGALVADPQSAHPAGHAQATDLKELVTRGCSKSERLLLILYYYEQLTMNEIGLVLGMSESRVSQIHSELLARLRVTLARRASDFLPLQD